LIQEIEVKTAGGTVDYWYAQGGLYLHRHQVRRQRVRGH